jgi:hypothetical protein
MKHDDVSLPDAFHTGEDYDDFVADLVDYEYDKLRAHWDDSPDADGPVHRDAVEVWVNEAPLPGTRWQFVELHNDVVRHTDQVVSDLAGFEFDLATEDPFPKIAGMTQLLIRRDVARSLWHRVQVRDDVEVVDE